MSNELTAELITSTWRPEEVRLSPDGRLAAWSSSPYGKDGEHNDSAIWIAEFDGQATGRRWTRGGADTRPRWSPDGSQLAFLSDREDRGTTGLFVLSVRGGEAEPVVVRKRSITAFAWSPDGTSLAFAAPDEPDEEDKRREDERDDSDVYGQRRPFNRLHLVDLETHEVLTLLTQDLHVTDVAWSPSDGATLGITVQATPEADEMLRASVWLVDTKTGNARRLSAAPVVGDLAWTTDGQRLVYVATHEQTPQSASTVWSVGTQPGDEPSTIGPGLRESSCGLGVRVVPGEERVVILVAEGLETRLEWCDPYTGSREPVWTATGDIADFDVAPGPRLCVNTWNNNGPLEVWTGQPDHLAQRSNHHEAWNEVTFGTVEDFCFTAVDGQALDGVVIRPATPVDGPAPMVVLIHGGPYGRSGRDLHCSPLDWGQWLATAGYAVLMPNYRGGFGHGERFAASVRGDMGGAEWGDVVAAVDAAVERGIADPDRLGIGGWSQGGFLTAWAVTRTDRFKAGVMGAGVSDWGAMALMSDVPTFEETLAGDSPWDHAGPHRGAERSPMSYASQRTSPLLILHGEKDERVPASQGTGFHRALRSQDTPVELVIYPREPHGIAERRHQQDLLRRVRGWYQRWIGES